MKRTMKPILAIDFDGALLRSRQFLLLYYYCETDEKSAKAKEKFVEVRWIDPKEYTKYFKTTVHPKIRDFLKGLN